MLYHFSEDPDIEIFIPRAQQNQEGMPPVVWAIDEEHSVNYFFPRDCPRVIYRRSSNVNEQDADRFFSHTTADTIIAVENKWIDRIRNVKLYRYTFSDERFELRDKWAGYYTSYKTVTPVKVEPFDDLIGRILSRGVELRFIPNLYPLRDAIIRSTVDYFSIIRFKNAAKPE
ncbi:DUF6886 family protein [Paenibacillus alkalitolerans]|uniref:DUF6886 family protein n=1 Tax=Paenibacillus alkalitolerans TaxID=2799335 RepID=UPI0018F2D115|nr:DUF6886 family protein [Paenibacillus alkalitolerans]